MTSSKLCLIFWVHYVVRWTSLHEINLENLVRDKAHLASVFLAW